MDNILYKEKTGAIYGTLFANYDTQQFDDTVNLFYARHTRWGIDTRWFKDKICLDAGCGGGRFVIALAKLGVKKVCGIDISREAIEHGKKRVAERGLSENTEFMEASVLNIPFEDGTFDYVISSGVIHHTPDPHKGFQELVRVLKPGGILFLSVYGRGGLLWYANDIFRYTVCKIMPFRIMNEIFKMIGVSANKRYVILDNLYVPYCFRFTETEIRGWLRSAGFSKVRRVKYERYDYEKLLWRILRGVGWMQIYAEKKI